MQRANSGVLAGDPLTLTIQDVALHLRVKGHQTVRDMIRRGECPPPDFTTGGRPRWIRRNFAEGLQAIADAEALRANRSAARQTGKGAPRSSAGGAEPLDGSEGAPPSTSADGEGDRHAS